MIRLAFIGCCHFAVGQYAQIAARVPNVRFTAVADSDQTKRSHAASQLKASITAGSLEELLANSAHEFDAVLIYSPTEQRTEQALRAAAAGKHVFVTTPLANSSVEAERIIAACQSAGVTLMTGQPSRFIPSIQTVKSTLAAGKLGDPGLLRIHSWEFSGTLDWLGWKSIAEFERGKLWTRLIRELDLAIWIFGQMPTEIHSAGRQPEQGSPNMPSAYIQVHLGFPQGGMSLIALNLALVKKHVVENYYSISLIGSAGAAYADDHHNAQLLSRYGTTEAFKANEGELHVLAMLREFADAIEREREPAVTGADGHAAIRLAVAVVKSLAEGCPLKLVGGRYEPV